MRKITQIAMNPETESNFSTLVALCDDGTLWQTWSESPAGLSFGGEWEQIPLVQQEPSPAVEPFTIRSLPNCRQIVRGNNLSLTVVDGEKEGVEAFIAWVNKKLGFPKDPNPS